MYKIAIFV